MLTKYLAKNSRSLSPIIEKGLGVFVYDVNGKRYLDAFSSYSSMNFGHSHPVLLKAFIEQSQKLSVFSRTCTSTALSDFCNNVNKYYGKFFKDDIRVLPMNSGVESTETSIKVSRKWAYDVKKVPLNEALFVVANGNYLGRTITAISASDYEYQKMFYPKVPGFLKCKYNDISSLETLFDLYGERICGVLLEPTMGEGGIVVGNVNYLQQVSKLCKKHNVLLIFDEIQSGMGRCDKGLCINDYNIKPDMVLLGKSLGSYIPISCTIGNSSVLDVLFPGSHSSTFGGIPLSCRMATETLDLLHNTDLVNKSVDLEPVFMKELNKLKTEYPEIISEIRGKGLMLGIKLNDKYDAWKISNELVSYNIITREANQNVLRLTVPLVINNNEIDYLFSRLNKFFKDKSLQN